MLNQKLLYLVPVITLVLFGIFGTKALLKPGFFSSHDGEHQLVRQYVFDRAIKAGHFPPRFDRQLQNHLGYPLFTFTYQLPFWLGEPFVLASIAIPDAVKIIFILTFIASGLTMYLFAKEQWGRLAGTLAAFLYLWAPYRFLTIFVRASLGEHVAFMFLPLLLWSLNSLRESKWRITLGAVSIAGLLLSHSMFAQISSLPIILYWLAQLWQEKNKLPYLVYTGITVLLGVGLTSFYLLPALYYRQDIQGLNRTFYAEHFVTLKQLIYSKWGYTFSVFGTENDGMSFQIGIAQWLVILGSVLAVVYNACRKKLHLTALALLLAFITSVFLMMDPSSRIWEWLVKWAVIDIPWRFLAVTTFTASALGGFIIYQLKPRLLKLIVVICLVTISLYTNRNHLRVNERLDFGKDWFTNYIGTSNSYDEYKPVHTSQTLLKREKLPPVEIIKGEAQIDILKDQPDKLLLQATNIKPVEISVNTVYFPGWEVQVDGTKLEIQKILSDGVPKIDLNPGKHTVKLTYQQTQVMQLANIVSLISSAILVGILITHKKLSLKRKKK